MRVFLIRHGCTAGNLEHRYVGTTDEGLTDEARQTLLRESSRYPVPDIVFASPMRRCLETAGLLFPGMEPVCIAGLRECAFGEFEYRNYQELQKDARYQAWIDSGGRLAFPGGETREAFADRCCEAFEQAVDEAHGRGVKSAAFVVHGGTIMAVMERFVRPARGYFDWQVQNGCGFACEVNRADDVEDDAGDGAKDDAKNNTAPGAERRRKRDDAADCDGCALSREVFWLEPVGVLPLAPVSTGIEEQYVMKQNKRLRCGYTTGSCAAAAAKGAVQMLLSGRVCRTADLLTPKGIRLHLPLEEAQIGDGFASCAVRKFAGDDPDATDGILICARAEYGRNVDSTSAGCNGAECGDGEDSVSVGSNSTECVDNENSASVCCNSLGYGNNEKSAFVGRNSAEHGNDENSASVCFNSTECGNDEDPARAACDNLDAPLCGNVKSRIFLDGGEGVGRVTKSGLEQPVGAAAINRVPREMIARAAEEICEMHEYAGTVKVTISVPEGREIAKKTFNPHIGIVGGISILGTSGIVVPMSEEALIASIRLEMQQKYANGERILLITPGNYGADFIRSGMGELDAENSMKCSNYVGETVDMAVEFGFESILFIAHIGKFIKVSGGVMNTHSAHADCRAELMAAQAVRAGADAQTVRRLLDTNTTEEAVGILKETNLLGRTMAEVAARVKFHLQKRCRGEIGTEAVLFSNQYGYLGETDGAAQLIRRLTLINAKEAEK